MAGERTLYRKIQVVLEYAREGKHTNTASLVDYIFKRQPTNFVYYARNKDSGNVEHRFSIPSIKYTVDLCISLRLMSPKLVLTKFGVSACDPGRFPAIIGRQASNYMSEAGLSLDEIERAIKTSIIENQSPPTPVEIWNRLDVGDEAMSFLVFKRLLSLLGQCKVLLMTQKRIFLPFSK